MDHQVDIGFLIGMPRSGTTWLCQRLSSHSNICAFGETCFFGRLFVPPDISGKYSPECILDILTKLGRASSISPSFHADTNVFKSLDRGKWQAMLVSLVDRFKGNTDPGTVFESICNAVAIEEDVSVVLEKTPHHLLDIDRIDQYMRCSPRYIIMYRNPYTFLLSQKHLIDRKAGFKNAVSKSIYHPILAAYLWKKYARQVLAARKKYANRSIEIAYEKLFDDELTTMNRIFDFLGCIPNRVELEVKNSSFSSNNRPTLASVEVFWVNLICSKYIRALHYDIELVEVNKMDVIFSLIRLPVSLLSSVKHLYRAVPGSLAKYLLRRIRH